MDKGVIGFCNHASLKYTNTLHSLVSHSVQIYVEAPTLFKNIRQHEFHYEYVNQRNAPDDSTDRLMLLDIIYLAILPQWLFTIYMATFIVDRENSMTFVKMGRSVNECGSVFFMLLEHDTKPVRK